MHPVLAQDLVNERTKQRLDDAAAARLGRRPRDRRHGRRAAKPDDPNEPKLRRLTLVVAQPTC